jgi:uncharacterized phiE125 gp8 family phage protein
MLVRSVVPVTQPEVEPVSLRAAKAQLGLLPEQEDDHELILRLIATGRRLVEQRLGVSLAARQYRATFTAEDFYPTHQRQIGVLRIPVSPLLVDVDHPLAITAGGVAVSSATYAVDADSRPAVVRFSSFPTLPADGTLVVTYWAGPAPGARIEPGLESAILLYVAHWYRNREVVITGTIAEELPAACETLLAAHSVTGAW